MMNVADRIPASWPAVTSSSSAEKPRRSAQRRYIRSSISAQSWASVPPAPACTSQTASRSSCSPENRLCSSRSSRARPSAATDPARSSSTEARASGPSAVGDLVERRGVVQLRGEAPEGLDVGPHAPVGGRHRPGVLGVRPRGRAPRPRARASPSRRRARRDAGSSAPRRDGPGAPRGPRRSTSIRSPHPDGTRASSAGAIATSGWRRGRA